MEPDKASTTALGSAWMRAYHATHDEPKIFDDPVAHRLLTATERAFWETRFRTYLPQLDPDLAASCPDHSTALRHAMRASASPADVFSRARYAEDTLAKAVRQGVGQYVLVGAGMDTFAFRHPDLQEHLQVFEVDHPASQTFKRQRLAQVGLTPPPNLHFVAADLAQESLATALERSPYAPDVPAFFGCLGVLVYLHRAAVDETLRAIRRMAASGSHLVFDYFDVDAFDPERAAARVRFMLTRIRDYGEPPVSGLEPHTLEAELAHREFRLVEHLHPDAIEARYFQGRTDGYHATEHKHFAWAMAGELRSP